jgi:hypothetical protein
MEAIDVNQNSIDAGQGLSGLPGSILQMTGNPLQVINPANLPVDPTTCKPIYPNQYLKVNTIFNVARDAGLRTAWSDKHPAYQAFSGPSGNGVQDFFTPEINSQAIGFPAGQDWTGDNAATMQYDSYKVHAILNEIDGYDHSRTNHVGVPAIFGMNFQTVSTAEKLPTSDGLTGGYLPGGKVPGPLLVRALNYINTEVGAMVSEIKAQGLADSTAIIISAKHGQSPNNIAGNPITVSASGLRKVYAGEAAADFFGAPPGEPRVPDILGIAQHGVVYTGGKGKIAEHGGFDRQDRNVPILVVLPGLQTGHVLSGPVETTQIAPTILKLLGLDPQDLQAVRIEHTPVLPGLRGHVH